MKPSWLSDARRIPDEVMSYLRVLAVHAIRARGESPEAIVRLLGLSRSSVYDWLKRFDEGGYEALETRQAPGAAALITPEMDAWLELVVEHTTPRAFGYPSELWSCAILAEVLERRYGITVTGSCVNQHLHRLGLSYQTPHYVPVERDREDVRYFLEEKFPRIRRLAERIGAEIGFEDEAGVDLREHRGRSWGPVGCPPSIPVTGQRGRCNALSMVMADGTLRYALPNGSIQARDYLRFLRQLLRGRERSLILLVDRVSFHRAKSVRRFVRRHRQQLRIYFLPRYSPELNRAANRPDEQVWHEIKGNRLGRQAIKNQPELKVKLRAALRILQHNAARVKSFFQLLETRYAAQ